MTNNCVSEFVKSVIEKYKSGQAKEHAYRPALEKLFGDISGLNVINDPKRSEYGAPDFVFMKGKVAAAYAEAKDIGVSLGETEKGEQLARYFGYSNLILTDCLEFRFFRNGQKYETVKIAEIKDGEIVADENNFSHLEDTIKEFINEAKEPIKSGAVLAKVMAGKARRIRDNIKKYLNEKNEVKNASLLSIYNAIKNLLLNDLDYEKFADMYAQTVVYGLFVARFHDQTPDTFSRQEARDLVPKSNPFLRKFFDHITGEDFDERIGFIVTELCEEFVHADVRAIINNYYKVEKDDSRDPIIHFYEDFLQEYDPAERKKMGVFYTPLPVVRFIVRAIDEILKIEFGLSGLVDAMKEDIVKESQGKKYKDKIHKVQILDPATGTGTFLNEVIRQIKESFKGQEGRWQSYIKEDLIPRLYGFELMMAPYTIAHLKISSFLKENGVHIGDERIGLYLTNSLEKGDKEHDTLFDFGLAKAISDESRKANIIKVKVPIMVVLGNPPYSGESSNNFESANRLVDKYKFEPGGLLKLKEKNPKWLNDDYVKFIAFSENLIDKNGEGVLGFITNHSYLDNTTFRGMRWELAQTFDEIHIVDLHGNVKKKEKHPDGSVDENIFGIQQGVAIIIAVKKKNKGAKKDAKVFVSDLYGTKKVKFNALNNDEIKYTEIKLDQHQYYFVNKNFQGKDEYDKGFFVNDLFIVSNVGIVTSADSILVAPTKEELLKQLYSAKEENSAKKTIQKLKNESIEERKMQKVTYRPFDNQYVYYEPNVIERARYKVMKNFIAKDNVGLIFMRGGIEVKSSPIFLSKYISESRSWSRPGMQGVESLAPLYLYMEDGSKIPNFNKEIVKQIEKIIGQATPENIFDYIYAILNSPSYGEKYKEFLKIDFPRVPYPKDEKQFFDLAKLGEELRHLHLFESPKINNFITTYSEPGDNLVEKVIYNEENVFINKAQFFGDVPKIAWEFYIGGYQPAQKWLKDRKGRNLSNSDIEHYQKIIVALVETGRIMKEIDKIKYE